MEHRNPSGVNQQGYPEGSVVCAIDPGSVDAAMAALAAAGFPADEIDIVRPGDVQELESPLDRPGLGGFIGRILLSLGGDLNELERMRRELVAGHVLLTVPVADDDASKQRLTATLQQHGGHAITYFGRWSITSLG
jgi:hypothetical protein